MRQSDLETKVGAGMNARTSGGAMIVAALAHGAHFTLIGRAYLYGLMAGGQEGVRRVIELLAEEVEVAMSLMGAATTADLTPASVRAPWLEG